MARKPRGDKTAEVQRIGKGSKSIEDTVAQEEAGEIEHDEAPFEASEVQPPLFPELDDSPEHKALLKLAKKLYKIRADRHTALVESKAIEDKTQEELSGKMHDAGITKFKFKTIIAEIVPRSEKVKVKLEVEKEAGEDDGEDD
jgi:hypothetical protein